MANAGSVTGPAEALKGNIESLSGSFTDSMILSSEGASMSEVQSSIKNNGDTNCGEIKDAAEEIANIVDNLPF